MNRLLGLIVSLGTFATAVGGEPVAVPYRLTPTQHVMLRVKIDGKGPFNVILDTGCPALVLTNDAAKKAGLREDKGKAVIDRLDFEGGLSQTKVDARIETPFQIEGMNSLGLAGVELHGLLGYTVLAHYRIEIDFSKAEMRWRPLEFVPPPPEALRAAKGSVASIEAMAVILKVASKLAGLKPRPQPVPRGFAGVEVEPQQDRLVVKAALAGGPADTAGLRSGDVVESVNGRKVTTVAELAKALADLPVGQETTWILRRADTPITVRLRLGHGF